MSSSNKKPFSIRIFLADGLPDGLRTIEKSNWSGRGVVCPRVLFKESKVRDDFGKAGIYILMGPSERSDVPRVYIGEGDPVRPRLEQHQQQKDFWTTAYFFVSKDDNLNKAHIQYLESKLVSLAREGKRCELDNGNNPTLPSLSEADAADADGFLDEMLVCLPVLGVSIFEQTITTTKPIQLLSIKAKGIEASGFEVPEGFVVRSGSRAVIEAVPSIDNYLVDQRKGLQARGVLMMDGTSFVFTQDYTFNSPSTAAGVILGRSSNGRTEWKDKQGRTLRQIQNGAVPGPVGLNGEYSEK